MLCWEVEYWEDRVNQDWWKDKVKCIASFIKLLYFLIFPTKDFLVRQFTEIHIK